MTSWILILLTFLPFLAAIIAYMLGRRDERAMNGFVPCPASAGWGCTCVRTASAGCTAASPPSCG